MSGLKRRPRRRRQGLSEIISAVLLVSLTIVLATIVLAFATSALGSSSISFSNLVGNADSALGTQLAIEQVTFPIASTVSYITLTISNTQSLSTASPFQEQIAINPSLYTTLESPDLGNIRFYETLSNSAFSNPIDSWLENASGSPANTGTSAIFWLNIPTSIPANSGITVYMVFLSYGTEFDGVISGEAPELSSTFGQYDNGRNVFSVYGGSSWSGFSSEGGGTWSTSAGGFLQQTATSGGGPNGGPAYVYTGSTYSATGSYVIESLLSYPSVSSGSNPRVGLLAVSTQTSSDIFGYRFIFQQSSNGAGALSFLNDMEAWVSNGGYQTSASTSYIVSVLDNGGSWSGAVYRGNSITSPTVVSLSANSYSAANYEGNTAGYVGVSAAVYPGGSTEANPLNVYWFRLRALPPNEIMPVASYSSLEQVTQTGSNIYVRNVGTAEASISTVYIDNATTGATLNVTQLAPPVMINPDSFVIIHLQLSARYGNTYTFVIVSPTGYEAKFNAQA